ncbi:short-chain dehydrogenase [Aliifodinibius salipaludis]|uniref:Short-chain dehydrogenase n=1 Tax=Fodinibius salipaludis TaxID=2032627 RepID=A0A2A2G7X0_9BACT|nr:SDR family oxidoreductase [Aliifodinibius salipaludis]PAU92923.1 short-chain dehydrogenase [Aliifodinibius salipaludis]
MELSDIKALVTGGSSGIGKATAKAIIEAGGKAVIAARGIDKLKSTADDIGAIPIQCDVRDEKQVINLVEDTIEELDGFNVLINNAGYGQFSKLTDLSEKALKSVLQVNTVGAMMVGREAARHFIDQDYGNIINVSSSAGKRGFEGGTAYCASKFALSGMTECWRAELRPHNIRVMQINPSEVQTEFFDKAGRGGRDFNPTKLVADDIAKAICNMLSLHDRGFITETSVWATNPQ